MKPLISLGFMAAGLGVAYLSACSTIVGITDLPSTLADGGSGSGSGSSSGGGSGGSSAFLGTWSGRETESGACHGVTATPTPFNLGIVITQGSSSTDLVVTEEGTTPPCQVHLAITSATDATLSGRPVCVHSDGAGTTITTTYESGGFDLLSTTSGTLHFTGTTDYTGASQDNCTFDDTGTLSL